MSGLKGRIRRAGAALHTIRVRLTLWYVALLALILIGFSAFLHVSLAQSLHAELDRSLETETLHLLSTIDVQEGQPSLGDEVATLDTGFLVTLYDATGTRRLGVNTRAPVPFPVTPTAGAISGQSPWDTVPLADGRWRVLTTPVVANNRVVGVLQVARSESEIKVALSQLASVLAIGIPLTLLLAISGGLFLAGRALGPIDRITRAAEQFGAEDLSRRLGARESDDEVSRLAATFDRMLDRLERAFERQRQFVADASHELRTPLALMLSQADVALARSRSSAEYRRVLTSVRDDVRRMTQLVSDLLTLARADVGQQSLVREPLDLRDIVTEVVIGLQPLAQTAGVELASGATDVAVIHGDQTRLTQLLINLTGNAITYTPAGGKVTVSVRALKDRAVLEVADTGIGIAPEHLPHLFERFYRVDHARSRSEGGSGLGLAISQWIARAHDGEITVTSRLGGGTTFTVSLPIVPRPAPPVRLIGEAITSDRTAAWPGL